MPTRFHVLLLATAAVLVAGFIAAFTLNGPLSWMVGFVYIGYDTWLLTHMVRRARSSILAEAKRAALPPRPGQSPSLAVLIAARSERTALPFVLDALLAQAEPAERILVIDDGSTDGSLDLLRERYQVGLFESAGPDGKRLGQSARHLSLQVLSKPNSGKARSLNAALPLCSEEVVITLDADTILDAGALSAVRRAFVQNPELTAGCGVLRPSCGPGAMGRVFELYQTFEYLRSFLWRVCWAREQTLVLVSGAFAVFRRDALAAVGGFDPTSHVEDYELLFRLHRKNLEEKGRPLEVQVIGEARATTDVPSRVPVFLRQRTRWFGGFIQTMFRNRDMVGNPSYGRLGSFHLLIKTVDMLLPVYGLIAFVSLLVLLVRGHTLPTLVLIALIAKLAFDFSCHVYSLRMHDRWQGFATTKRRFARAALATLTEPLGFQLLRQVGALSGWISFARGRSDWAPQRAIAKRAEEI